MKEDAEEEGKERTREEKMRANGGANLGGGSTSEGTQVKRKGRKQRLRETKKKKEERG